MKQWWDVRATKGKQDDDRQDSIVAFLSEFTGFPWKNNTAFKRKPLVFSNVSEAEINIVKE